jgi:LacI family transcriptional regulator
MSLGFSGQAMDNPRRIAIALEIDEPHSHHQDVYAGIMQYAQDRPNWVCYIDEHPGVGGGAMIEGDHPYDGVIARATPDMIRRLKRKRIPLVNTHFQVAKPGLVGVYADLTHTGRLAAEHLISLGMPRLGFISDPIHKSFAKEGEAFVEYAEQKGVPTMTASFVEPQYRDKAGWIQLKKNILSTLKRMEPPIGVYISTGPMARVLIQLAQANGWRVPRDMAVLCARDLTSIVEVSPKISSLQINYTRMGYVAAELLDGLIDGQPEPEEPVLISHATLIARESTDYRVVEDPIVAAALRYISERLAEPLTVSGIAYKLNLSPRLLQQRFAEKLGVAVSNEIRRLRLEKAKRLLTEPERPITSIPQSVGFNSANAMNKIFVRELGMTPSAYRKQILDNRPYNQRDH